MFDRRWIERVVLLAGLGVAVGLAALPVPAEVAAVGTGQASSYALKSIIDDTEPVHGIIWQRFNQDSPTRVVLNEEGALNGDGDPSLSRSAQGFPVVAWSRNSPGGFDVVVSRFENGAWSAPAVVAGSAADELDPVLVLDPASGWMHLLFWIADGAPRVMHAQAPPDLSSWTVPVRISGPAELAARPSAAVRGGTLFLIYEVHDHGWGAVPRQIVLAEQEPSGFTPLVLGVTWHAAANWPQIHAGSDRMWAEWIDSESSMVWSRRFEGDPWGAPQPQAFGTPEARDYHVRGQIRQLALE